ncbi:MAG: helix-turn-helix transcriptional regulator [Saprospiraceae bacterium]|nr:helix-turn-helix transcriptional regulator [Saprospiraceae bacterium]
MSNLHDALQKTTSFKKFEVDDVLFVEYTCDPGGPKTEIWSHTNYFTYVVSGRMALKTPTESHEIKSGEAYFITRGGFIIPEFFEEVFCDLIIFTPDEFIRSVIEKHQIPLINYKSGHKAKAVTPVHLDETLKQYYHTLLTYFQNNSPPSKALLRLKLEELIVTILTGRNNPGIAAYLSELYSNHFPTLRSIMEKNYARHLTLTEFARLCTRSLSTFRRDFQIIYGVPPGQWLKEKRLELGRQLLLATTDNIEDIAFESGFRNRTHFIRCFKERYHISPHQFRSQPS